MCLLSGDSYVQVGIYYWNSFNSSTEIGILMRLLNSGEYLVLELHCNISNTRGEIQFAKSRLSSGICFYNELTSFACKYNPFYNMPIL